MHLRVATRLKFSDSRVLRARKHGRTLYVPSNRERDGTVFQAERMYMGRHLSGHGEGRRQRNGSRHREGSYPRAVPDEAPHMPAKPAKTPTERLIIKVPNDKGDGMREIDITDF